MRKIILDLCGGTGAWSKPYRDAGYDVKLITLPDHNILYTTFGTNGCIHFFGREKSNEICINRDDVYGILAAPPCTMFSLARTKANKPRDLEEGMECVRACLDVIWKCMEKRQPTKQKTVGLKFWALENPYGMLKYFIGKPAMIFNPYDFGDLYQKKTALWGWFNEPKRNPIELPKKLKELHKTNSQPLPVLKAYKSLNPVLQKKFDKLASREIHPEVFGKLTRQERRAITPQQALQKRFLKLINDLIPPSKSIRRGKTMEEKVEIEYEQIIYRDVDYLNAPMGWLSGKLDNKVAEGWSIFRDWEKMAWIAERPKSINNFPIRKTKDENKSRG